MNLQRQALTPKSPPEQVVDAAAQCFLEKGYQGASLDDVARHMGATKGRIYHYFSSKSELMQAVQQRAMEINFAAIRPAFESDLPPVEKFRRMALAHARNMIANRAYQQALFDSLALYITRAPGAADDPRQTAFLADRRAFEDMFRQVLEAGRKTGDFRIRTLTFTLHAVLTTLNSTLYWYTPRDGDTEADHRKVAEELVDMALGALGAKGQEQG